MSLASIALLCATVGSTLGNDPTEKKCVADISIKVSQNGQAKALHGVVSGPLGQPLNAGLGVLAGNVATVKIERVANSNPSQYTAHFFLAQGNQVISSPKVITTVGQKATVQVGNAADQLSISVTIDEK